MIQFVPKGIIQDIPIREPKLLLHFLGEFDNNFTCDENEQQECHWAYIPPVDPEDPEDLGSWVKCSGEYRELDN
jgi:hypothetical protein